jgi:hypothetical protein
MRANLSELKGVVVKSITSYLEYSEEGGFRLHAQPKETKHDKSLQGCRETKRRKRTDCPAIGLKETQDWPELVREWESWSECEREDGARDELVTTSMNLQMDFVRWQRQGEQEGRRRERPCA